MMWAQVADERTLALPPDGKTSVDVFAQFSFSGILLGNPALGGTPQIHFAVGSGSAKDANNPTEFLAAIVPVDGISLISNSVLVENQIVRNADGSVSVSPVAKVTLNPISSSFSGTVTVAAYSTYDRLGTAQRFSVQEIQLTAAKGSGAFSGTMEVYDTVGNTWETKTSMKTGRSGLFSEYANGKIYAIGGYAQEFIGNVEEYDITTDTWTDKNPMPTVRGFGCSVVYNKGLGDGDEIYVFGGYNYDPSRARPELERYTPLTDTWTVLTSMPIRLAFQSCVLIGTDVYVFYGASKIDDKEKPSQFNSGVMKYNILADAWSFVKSTYGSPTSTTVAANAPIGSTFIKIVGAALQQSGFATIVDINTSIEETLAYSVYSNATILLVKPTTINIGIGSSVVVSSTKRQRLSCGIFSSGNLVTIYDGFDGTNYLSSIETYDVLTKVSSVLVGTTGLARSKSAISNAGLYQYVIGGSAKKSDYLADMERVLISTGVFSGGLAKPDTFRTSSASASNGNLIYVMGGQASGHDVGWINLSCTANPSSVLADGRASVAITVAATDAGGDPPPTIKIRLKGLIFLHPAIDPSTAATAVPTTRNTPPTISILPVLFSAQEFYMVAGTGSTTLLPRSEDEINEVNRLTDFVKGNEVLLSQQQLKQQAAQLQNTKQEFGQTRTLYNVAIEATVIDDKYFGTSNSSLVVGTAKPPATGSFFNPSIAKEGLSASVEFFSDIVSIPNVEFLTTEPVDGTSAKKVLDGIRKIIPFGASPHYDAIVGAAQRHIGEDPFSKASMMISTCDNENSGSVSTSNDVIASVNSVFGEQKLPVFITTFVITNPISLSARKARTDVAELEDISTQTGGNSFSVLDPIYTDFVVNRIKTSAPASIGSGTIEIPHNVEGTIYSISYTVDNLSVEGNFASILIQYSTDNYEFKTLDADIPPNSEFLLVPPIAASKMKYKVKLQSGSFDTPVLKEVVVKYVRPSIQYVLTQPRLIAGQLTDVAAVTNQRVPDGCKVDVGVCHGDSIMFDRDFVTDGQPSISDRGVIVAINRESDAIVDSIPHKELLRTSNFISYIAESGPWASDAIVRVYIDEQEAADGTFFSIPNKGSLVFKNKLSAKNVVEILIQNPEKFRLGLRIENPTLQDGKLDSFAFSWGTTQGTSSLKPKLPPTARNLFVSPSPAFPGGPLFANYIYHDPNGDPEDKGQTLIIWYRDGVPIPELNNKTSILNSDIIAKRIDSSPENKISRGQQWSFSVRPSNGFVFGESNISGPITISNNPPVALNPRFTSSNLDPKVFTSSDVVNLFYDYFDKDGDLTKGDIIEWFVNDVSFKTGTVNSLSPNEVDKSGVKALKSGNIIKVQITPFDGYDYGGTITSNPLTITATPPSVTDPAILPTLPSVASTLKLTYRFVDPDGNADQSLIAWFVDGVRKPELDQRTDVPPVLNGRSLLVQRQKWYAIITPSDGQVQGTPVTSNTVVIQF